MKSRTGAAKLKTEISGNTFGSIYGMSSASTNNTANILLMKKIIF